MLLSSEDFVFCRHHPQRQPASRTRTRIAYLNLITEITTTGSTASSSLTTVIPFRVFPRSHRSPTAEASSLSLRFRSPLPDPLQAAPLPEPLAPSEHSRNTKGVISIAASNLLLMSPFFRILVYRLNVIIMAVSHTFNLPMSYL